MSLLNVFIYYLSKGYNYCAQAYPTMNGFKHTAMYCCSSQRYQKCNIHKPAASMNPVIAPHEEKSNSDNDFVMVSPEKPLKNIEEDFVMVPPHNPLRNIENDFVFIPKDWTPFFAQMRFGSKVVQKPGVCKKWGRKHIFAVNIMFHSHQQNQLLKITRIIATCTRKCYLKQRGPHVQSIVSLGKVLVLPSNLLHVLRAKFTKTNCFFRILNSKVLQEYAKDLHMGALSIVLSTKLSCSFSEILDLAKWRDNK
ncbi:hypothetical protein BDC45DRAFT_534263 [Circinella umbellata]|nr:hypothetical protein BDC45DRAFT_534263 [Circinella umbellata]